MCLGCDGLKYLGQTGYKGFAVGLMDFVLHGLIDEVRLGWRLTQGGSEQGEPLEVKDL